jgi:hypothetical protein
LSAGSETERTHGDVNSSKPIPIRHDAELSHFALLNVDRLASGLARDASNGDRVERRVRGAGVESGKRLELDRKAVAVPAGYVAEKSIREALG